MTTRRRRLAVAAAALAGLTLPAAAAGAPAGTPAGAGVGDPASEASHATSPGQHERTAGQRLLLRWQDGTSAPERSAAVRAVGGALVHDLGGAGVVELPHAGVADAARARLARDPRVAAVEPDRLVRAAATDDPGYAQQWGLENTGQDVFGRRGRPGVDARALDAWAQTVGEPEVLVAIVDSGMDVEHPDLADNIWRNPYEEPNGLDDDGNGLVDDVAGWDFMHDDASVYDDPEADSHGTELAGVVAAVADNGIGVAGIAPQVRVLPVKFLEAGVGAMSDGLAGLRYAASQGADVIVASWVGDRDAPLLAEVIAGTGVLVVGPAGNDGRDLRIGAASYPASYTLPNLLSVAAIDNQGFVAPFSNRGSHQVDLAAPGASVLTTESDDRYAYVSGTSMAAAFTAGAAALATVAHPRAGPAEMADLVRRSTRPYATVADVTISGGLLDAGALVDLAAFAARPGACEDPPPSSFGDVSRSSPHVLAIDCLVFRGGSEGRSPSEFAPRGYVTRGAMATFLLRVVEAAGIEATDPPDAFTDDDGSVHEPSIDTVAWLGIVQGVSEDTYAPAEVVTRAQMATMLRRTYQAIVGDPGPPSRDWFDDDAPPHGSSIDVVRDLGIAAGAAPRQFEPALGVRRDQMASFLVSLLDVLARSGAVTPS